jgi:cell division protein FtsN
MPAQPPRDPPPPPAELQLGFFSKREQAQAAWKAVQGQPVMGGRTPDFLRSGPFIRLLVSPFGDQTEAVEACAAIKAAGHNACVAVAPAAQKP